MRLVDADALIKQIENNICKPCRKRKDDYKGVRCKACQYGDEKDDIDSAPIAQPEIVRCKDCKYQVKEWRDDKRFKDKGYWVYGCEVMSDICGYWAWFGQDDEYCSEAERRTDE